MDPKYPNTIAADAADVSATIQVNKGVGSRIRYLDSATDIFVPPLYRFGSTLPLHSQHIQYPVKVLDRRILQHDLSFAAAVLDIYFAS